MFKEPFSFEGRIRRTEYGISVIILVIAMLATYFLMFAVLLSTGHLFVSFFAFLIGLVPVSWFSMAQNVKRCHDMGRSGWHRLIPFYGLVLLFGPGDVGDNRFGPDPKESEDNY